MYMQTLEIWNIHLTDETIIINEFIGSTNMWKQHVNNKQVIFDLLEELKTISGSIMMALEWVAPWKWYHIWQVHV